MSFYSMKCPKCQKKIQVPIDVNTAICMYCGESISCNNIIQVAVLPNIANLMGLARTASVANNVEEAEKYYTQVLEHDPTIPEAWFGKGKSAGWRSTLSHMRLNEMLIAFQHAISTTPSNEQNTIVTSCVSEVNTLVVALYGIAQKHMLEFISLENTWRAYIGQIEQLINALEGIHILDSSNTITLENIIHLCKDSIEGVTYKDQFDNNKSKVWHLTPEYETLLREKLEKSADKLQILNPNYVKPSVEAKKAEGCFIITATMDNPYHPNVLLMREFRDQWLIHRQLGRIFIAWYYRHGPTAADIIRYNKSLRILSYVFIVIPSSLLARLLLKYTKP